MWKESFIILKFLKGKLSIECLVSLFGCLLDSGTLFKTILIIKQIKRFTFAMNQENREINLEVERILIDYNEYLSRATEEDVIYIYFFFFFFFEKELVDGSDQIYIYWIMLV